MLTVAVVDVSVSVTSVLVEVTPDHVLVPSAEVQEKTGTSARKLHSKLEKRFRRGLPYEFKERLSSK